MEIIFPATTIEDDCRLKTHLVDAIIAQGIVASEDRGMFFFEDFSSQVSTFELLVQII